MNLPAEYVNIMFNTLTVAPTTLLWPTAVREEWGRLHEEMEMKGAIMLKEHNDGVTWDRAAMEQAKP